MPPAARLKHGAAAALISLVLLPAAAHAQGAGDDQYSDPFGGDATPTATPHAKATATPRPAATSAPTTTPAATATPAEATTAAPPATTTPPSASTPVPAPAAAVAAPAGQLPYTGIDAWPIAAAGFALLGAGITLRLRLRALD